MEVITFAQHKASARSRFRAHGSVNSILEPLENHEKLGVPKTMTSFGGACLLHNFLPQGHGKKVLISFMRTALRHIKHQTMGYLV